MGKDKHFKFKVILNFSYEAEIHVVPKNMGKRDFNITGKARENTNISNLWVF